MKKKNKRKNNRKQFGNQGAACDNSLAAKLGVKTETRRLSDQEAREVMGDKYQKGETYLVDEVRMPSDLYRSLPPELRPLDGVCTNPEEYEDYQKTLDEQEKFAAQIAAEMEEEQRVLKRAIKVRSEFEARGETYNGEGLTDEEKVILQRAEERMASFVRLGVSDLLL